VLIEAISPYHNCVIRRRRFTQTTDYDMNPDPALRTPLIPRLTFSKERKAEETDINDSRQTSFPRRGDNDIEQLISEFEKRRANAIEYITLLKLLL
jgi:hypothetical protein